MDRVEKSRVRLTHWIDHNLDHLRGYSEVAATLETEGLDAAAKRIKEGIRLIEQANSEFTMALADISRALGHKGMGHTHTPGHSHGHSDDHTHSEDE